MTADASYLIRNSSYRITLFKRLLLLVAGQCGLEALWAETDESWKALHLPVRISALLTKHSRPI